MPGPIDYRISTALDSAKAKTADTGTGRGREEEPSLTDSDSGQARTSADHLKLSSAGVRLNHHEGARNSEAAFKTAAEAAEAAHRVVAAMRHDSMQAFAAVDANQLSGLKALLLSA
ncbi:MAG: hypothetical protein FD130_574 [Halothiobacillaceae bacterium]|nr:MAG: hypothetical protein FD130_574 [Halothiobacillaceae bacterium]